MERRRTLMGRIRQSLSCGGDEDGEEDFLGESGGSCSLSPLQRMYGFAACLVSGFACMFLSLIVFFKPIKFAILFTFGNLFCCWKFSSRKLAACRQPLTLLPFASGCTAFLIGPSEQLRLMIDPVRIYATSICIGSVLLALISALLIHSKILTLIAIISEICALTWYSLSYVPFARRMVSELIICCCDTEI